MAQPLLRLRIVDRHDETASEADEGLPSRAQRVVDAVKLVALGGIGLAALGGLLAYSGCVDVSARSGHAAGMERLLVFAREHSVARHADVMTPPKTDRFVEADVERGALAFDGGCAGCHGAPGRAPASFAAHMYPQPPELAKERSANPTAQEMAWVVDGGLMDTGMPAWPARRDDEVWAVARFLERLPELDAAGYQRLVAGPPDRHGLPEMGGELSDVRPEVLAQCVGCHGRDGKGRANGAIPNLSFQTQQYLHDSLQAYAEGDRRSGIMGPQAQRLTVDERKALAAYFARQSDDHPTVERGPADLLARGKEIAVEGSEALAPCMSCHGVMERNGYRAELTIPQLRGQYAAYVYTQLAAFRAKQRGLLPYHQEFDESGLLHVLPHGDMEAVALYFASLDSEVASR